MLAMLRKIQLAATLVATIFSAGALFDLIMVRVGKLDAAAISGGAFPLADLPFAPDVTGTLTFLLGGVLVGAAVMAQMSVWSSGQASQSANRARLDAWRRLTWGASITETAGCLLFIFSGTLLYLPSAVALLLTGVAELATIWHDMDHRNANAHSVLPREKQAGS
jgi:hypothetical protein